MRKKLLLVLLAASATAGIAAAVASASGPAAPGKELVPLTCDGLGTITVSVQRGENANGADQSSMRKVTPSRSKRPSRSQT
jgi:hypothetical protein